MRHDAKLQRQVLICGNPYVSWIRDHLVVFCEALKGWGFEVNAFAKDSGLRLQGLAQNCCIDAVCWSLFIGSIARTFQGSVS